MPLGSLYHATKFAVEGFSEALMYEMKAIGVGVKIVEPGLVETDFSSRSIDAQNDPNLTEYQDLVQTFISRSGDSGGYRSTPGHVAEVIFDAATDDTDRLRYPSGDDAIAAITRRKELPEDEFLDEMRSRYGL